MRPQRVSTGRAENLCLLGPLSGDPSLLFSLGRPFGHFACFLDVFFFVAFFEAPGAVKQEKTYRNTETNSKINFIFGAFTSARLPRFFIFWWPTGHQNLKNRGKRAARPEILVEVFARRPLILSDDNTTKNAKNTFSSPTPNRPRGP